VSKFWLLDIDGVVNAVGTAKTREGAWRDWKERTVNGYKVAVADAVKNLLWDAYYSNTTILWHTTWQDSANRVANKFQIPNYDIADAPEYEAWNRFNAKAWWKTPAVKRMLNQGHKILWTDDQIDFYASTDPATSEILEHENLTYVCPDALTGLNKADVDQIRAFIGDRSASRTPPASGEVRHQMMTDAEASIRTRIQAEAQRSWAARLERMGLRFNTANLSRGTIWTTTTGTSSNSRTGATTFGEWLDEVEYS